MSDSIPDDMVTDILETIKRHDADCMGLICPTCFDKFDTGQVLLERKLQKSFQVPIVYYFQLLGIAQGLAPKDVGLHRHKVKVDRILDMAVA